MAESYLRDGRIYDGACSAGGIGQHGTKWRFIGRVSCDVEQTDAVAAELSTHRRSPWPAANSAHQHGLAAKQRMRDGGIQRGSAGRCKQLASIDLGVLLRHPVQPVENVQRGPAHEQNARPTLDWRVSHGSIVRGCLYALRAGGFQRHGADQAAAALRAW